jgi:hypothetical protein
VLFPEVTCLSFLGYSDYFRPIVYPFLPVRISGRTTLAQVRRCCVQHLNVQTGVLPARTNANLAEHKKHLHNIWLVLCYFRYRFVRTELDILRAVKNAVFWDVTPCGSLETRCEGTYRLYNEGVENRRAGNNVSSN